MKKILPWKEIFLMLLGAVVVKIVEHIYDNILEDSSVSGGVVYMEGLRKDGEVHSYTPGLFLIKNGSDTNIKDVNIQYENIGTKLIKANLLFPSAISYIFDENKHLLSLASLPPQEHALFLIEKREFAASNIHTRLRVTASNSLQVHGSDEKEIIRALDGSYMGGYQGGGAEAIWVSDDNTKGGLVDQNRNLLFHPIVGNK
ncbi:MAG: hypothetical protein JAY74_14695 [Candidatus Thiodiazotropha taylori]|nr:hypothetical protein [Candidatus Thiodiazotropha taylori]